MTYTPLEQQLLEAEAERFWALYHQALVDAMNIVQQRQGQYTDIIPVWHKVDMEHGYAAQLLMKVQRIQYASTEQILKELPDLINYAAFKIAYEALRKEQKDEIPSSSD